MTMVCELCDKYLDAWHWEDGDLLLCRECRSKGPPMWTRDQALGLVRTLEPKLADAGFHVALGGGVLMRGESYHDLDLIVYPHQVTDVDRASIFLDHGLRVHQVLRACGLDLYRTWGQMWQSWRAAGSQDTKFVEVWMKGTRRVDVIYLA